MVVDIAMAIPPGNSRVLAYLKSRVSGMTASSIEELVNTFFEQSAKYDTDTLEKVWQSLFKVYNQTLPNEGSDDVSVEHTGVSVRQRAGTLERGIKHDKETFHKALEYLASGCSDGEND